jgi:hypothetical protein
VRSVLLPIHGFPAGREGDADRDNFIVFMWQFSISFAVSARTLN